MNTRRALLLAAAAAPLAHAAGTPASGIPVRWPPVTLLDGTRWQPEPAHGQVLVLWSLTCPFCQRHNEHVQKLHLAIQARGGPGLLTAVREQDAAAVRRHLARKGWTFPVTLDSEPLMAAFAARRIVPLTLVVDAAGRLAQSLPGEMFEEDVLELQERAA